MRERVNDKVEDHIQIGKWLFEAFGWEFPEKEWATEGGWGLDFLPIGVAKELRGMSQDPIMTDPANWPLLPNKREDLIAAWQLLKKLTDLNHQSRFFEILHGDPGINHLFRTQLRQMKKVEEQRFKPKPKSERMRYDCYEQRVILTGDALAQLKTLPDESVQSIITSVPYYKVRDYGVEGQIGLEDHWRDYIRKLVEVFHEARRVLKSTGTMWLNIDDCYGRGTMGRRDAKSPGASYHNKPGSTYGGKVTSVNRHPPNGQGKNLLLIPQRLIIALQEDNWIVRQDIIWHKTGTPEPVKDRPARKHEYIYLLTKSPKYYYDHNAAKVLSKDTGKMVELGTDWYIPIEADPNSHFATFPFTLVERCMRPTTRVGDTILDPFGGTHTTGVVATYHGRHYIGIELNPKYSAMMDDKFQFYAYKQGSANSKASVDGAFEE
jgi:site-specific DNA-methyltransferase (adenine-specific)